MIYFFSYFWTTVVFSPDDMARQLKENGSFIPGLRPGPRTAEYLETVVERVTYVGAGFLAVIAVIPSIVNKQMEVPFMVSSFLGGTGLLIVVSVGLDLLQRVEANLMMRNYSGFLGGSDAARPSRAGRRS
jgi:preprotein translocase subunit SecY